MQTPCCTFPDDKPCKKPQHCAICDYCVSHCTGHVLIPTYRTWPESLAMVERVIAEAAREAQQRASEAA